jgi:hypothetical protein
MALEFFMELGKIRLGLAGFVGAVGFPPTRRLSNGGEW